MLHLFALCFDIAARSHTDPVLELISAKDVRLLKLAHTRAAALSPEHLPARQQLSLCEENERARREEERTGGEWEAG